MKKLLALTLAFAAILFVVGCESGTTPDKPIVTATVITNGAGLKLDWSADANADGFIIYNDGVAIDTVVATTYNDTIPCKVVEVSAYAGDKESDKESIDCTPTTTSTITVYGMSDTSSSHPSGLVFNATSGTGVATAVISSNYAALDFIFDDRAPLTQLTLVNAGTDTTIGKINTKLNTSGLDGTDFNAVKICKLTGYNTITGLATNNVYDLWLSSSATWLDTDHFGKMKIESITGATAPYTAVVTVAYQKFGGLRWCVTP
jgi:hypothetical protein